MKKFVVLAYYYSKPKPKNTKLVKYLQGQVEETVEDYILDAVFESSDSLHIKNYLHKIGKLKYISEIYLQNK